MKGNLWSSTHDSPNHAKLLTFSPLFHWCRLISAPKTTFLSPCPFFGSLLSFTNNHTFSPIFAHKEPPWSWKLMFTQFDIWYFILNSVDCNFFKIFKQHVYFVKDWGHAVVGKETLKYNMQALISGGLSDFPSL